MTTLASSNRIRNASLLDLAELTRLLRAAAHTVAGYLTCGHLFVLEERDGTIQAACHVDMRTGQPTIDLLVVNPAHEDTTVRKRMVGVAYALCGAT